MDLAGCLISVRFGTGVKIKVVSGEFDPEDKYNRSVTSDANCKPRSIRTSRGGVARIRGYFDPSSAGVVALFDGATATNGKILFDGTGAATAGIVFTDGPSSEPGTAAFNFAWTAETEENGMQIFTVELHSQYGTTRAT